MAIPKIIEELAHKIRTAIYGKDVRESLASGIEKAGEIAEDARKKSDETDSRQTELETRFEQQIQNMTLEDPSSAEIVDARGGETLLRHRLDKVDAQLAQNAYLANSLKNSKADRAEVQSFESMLNDIIVSNGDGSKDTELIASRGGFDTLPERLNAKESILDNIDKSLLKFVNEVDNGDFSQDGDLGSGLYRWLTSDTVSLLSASDNTLKVEPNPDHTNGRIYVGTHWLEIPPNHVFYICFSARTSGEGTFNLAHGSGVIGSSTTQSTDFNSGTSFGFYSQIFTANDNGTNYFRIQSHDFTNVGDFFEMRYVSIIDLTKAFGAGNEPSKKSLDRVMQNIGWFDDLKYVPYNEVIELKISSLPSQDVLGIKGVTVVNGVGDGVTDDTTAIQSALNEGAGGRVFLPPGTYLVSRTLYIPDNTIFVGAGLNSKIKLSKNHTLDSIPWRTFDGGYIIKPILTNNRESGQAKNIRVENLHITAEGVTDQYNRMGGLIFADAYNCHAEKVYVNYINWVEDLTIDYRGFNIACTRSEKISFINTMTDHAGYECIGTFDDSKDVLVQGNFIGTGKRCSAQIHRNNFNITFDANFMKQDQDYFADAHGCLVIHGSSTRPAKGLTITNNFFEVNNAYAVVSFVEFQRDVIFSGNQINGEDIIGLRINGDNKDFTVTGNKIRVNRTGLTASCLGSLLISDNDIKAASVSGDAVNLDGVESVNLQGNALKTDRYGVRIANVTKGVLINSNIIDAVMGSFAADYSSDPKIMIGQNIA